MALSFAFYEDAALTLPLTGNLIFQLPEIGPPNEVIKELWIGSVVADRKIQIDADPGVDPIVVSIADSTPGSGPEVTDVALSLDGIIYETGGDPLDLLVTEILSTPAGAVKIWAKGSIFGGATSGNYIEVRLVVAGLREVSV